MTFVFGNKGEILTLSWITTQMEGRREGEGRRGDAEDEERKEVTLRASPEPCQQQQQRRWHQREGCAGTSETGQTTAERRELRRNKEPRLSPSRHTACVQLLLCHTQTAPRPQGAAHAGSTWRTYSWREAPPPSHHHPTPGPVCAVQMNICLPSLSLAPSLCPSLSLGAAWGGEWWQSCWHGKGWMWLAGCNGRGGGKCCPAKPGMDLREQENWSRLLQKRQRGADAPHFEQGGQIIGQLMDSKYSIYCWIHIEYLYFIYVLSLHTLSH